MRYSYTIQGFSLLALCPYILCGSDEEGLPKKNRWFRPKNDRPNVPMDAYHPGIPDQVEVRSPGPSYLKNSRSQYLPKSTYEAESSENVEPVPPIPSHNIEQLQHKRSLSRNSHPPENVLPFAQPIGTFPNPGMRPKTYTSRPERSKEFLLRTSKDKETAVYERQDFEWKYTSLLIDQLFDHLLMREEDEHTCALIIQEKNYLLRLVTYKG